MSHHMITTDELNAHLWGAADILRGTADASDFKNHIFGLLFLKRLSDVFDERRQEIIDEYVKSGRGVIDICNGHRNILNIRQCTRICHRDLHVIDIVPTSIRWILKIGGSAKRLATVDRQEDQLSEGKSKWVRSAFKVSNATVVGQTSHVEHHGRQ